MKGDSKVQKSFLNAKVNTLCFFASLVVSFFTRKVLLDQLGATFMGLAGTLDSLLRFLNVAELGVGTAISYVLYKPLSESNQLKINEVVSVLGYLYRCIGYFILVAGCLLSLALPFIFSNTSFDYSVIYLGFYAYLTSSLIGYYINYKQVLLCADQRNYEVTGYYQLVGIVISLLQMAFALYTGNFYIYFTLQLLGGILFSILLYYRVNKVYPWLQSDVGKGRSLLTCYPEVTKYIKQVFVHRIGSFVQFEISPFLVYTFVSLPMVAIYMNYSLLTDKLSILFKGIMDSTSAGVGHLISEGDSTKIWDVYRQLFSFRFFVSGLCCASFYFIVNGFIYLWLGAEYKLPDKTVLLLTVSLFLVLARGTTDQFINGYGMFYDVWAPVAESALFLIFSVSFGMYMGLNGILLGPIISMAVIVYIWKPYFLFSKGLRRNLFHYVIRFVFYTASIYLCALVCIELMSMINIEMITWHGLFLKSLIFVLLYFVVLFTPFYTVSGSFRQVVHTSTLHFLKRA